MYRFSVKVPAMFICTMLLTLILIFSANAETNSDDEWKFQLTPYAWLAGQNGKVATLPGLPPTDIDVDFYDDVLGNINGGIFLIGEVRKGHWGGLADIAYTDIEFEDATPGPLFSSVKSRTKSWIVSATGFYRLVQEDRTFLDVLVGLRYWSIDSTLSLSAGILETVEITHKEDWVDPLIGLRGFKPIGKSKVFVSGAFLVGGFSVGSDLMWDASINLGYQWTKGFSTTLGYRYLDVDYENNDFLYDIAQDGITMGLMWRF